MLPLVFVTGNAGKAKEAEIILETPIETIKIDLPEIQSMDIAEIVKYKAQAAYDQIRRPVIVDDSGFYFSAWNGFPGPLVKWIDKAGGIPLMLKMFAHEPDRSAEAICCIGYHDGTSIHTFTGIISGTVTTEARGTDGWGWDPIFIAQGSDKTFAEMTAEEKSHISHRRLALEQLKSHLATLITTPHSHSA